jgi:DNA polymerase-3 subunit delta'
MWLDIRGHDQIAERFRRTLTRGRLASTYLFVGPSGIGKRTFALQLAQSLLCNNSADKELIPCGKCQSCVLFAAGNHPDFLQIRKPPEKSSLPIESFIGKDEKRNQEGLCHDISLRPMISGRRVAIIDDADYFNESSANCLLKTLEEPPRHSLIILLGTSLAKQLPTIRSRSQVVRFATLSESDVTSILLEQKIVSDPTLARQLAPRSGGSVEAAIAAQDMALWTFREAFLKRISTTRIDDVRVAKVVEEFVKEAGSAAPPRRARQRHVIGFAVELFRALLHTMLTADSVANAKDYSLRESVERLVSERVSADQALLALQTCLEAEENVFRNANQSTLIQWWLSELAGILAPRNRNVRISPV